MSDKVDDGGPAFPFAVQRDFHAAETGMTLRDWFAGQALANEYTTSDAHPHRVAEWAYQIADAMLAARKGARDE